MVLQVSSDTSQRLDWYIRRKTDVSISFDFASFDTNTLTLSAGIYRNKSLLLSPSISNDGTTITLSLTDTQTDIKPNHLFWQLKTTTPIDQVLFTGVFYVNDSAWDSGNSFSSESFILDINSSEVTVTVNI